MEQELSLVKRRTEIKFLMTDGLTRTVLRERGRVLVGKDIDPERLTGIIPLFATMTVFPMLF